MQEVSYALGASMGEGLLQNSSKAGITLDLESLLKGVGDGFSSSNKFDEAKMQQSFAKLDSIVMEQQKLAAAKDKEFLEQNKNTFGIITTPSGLQYKVITMGDGPTPAATDKVKVHYHGTTIDGTVFDSSVDRGEPITFALNQVIKGWTEGVQLMPVGSKFIFCIPSELAYGEQGAGNGVIKPGATLIFEIELLGIEQP
ncbi:MAG: FKBP-type peptidyl-prolyl cis-trans isomerase [Prevotellaceae bacterium]|nr:FKBP-type peptidyl-prolyl cis-trans isomerase [Prevotellaceae bacterium]